MILFTIVLIMVLIVGGLAILAVGAAGAAGIILFAEPILCIVMIVLLVKFLVKKRKRQ